MIELKNVTKTFEDVVAIDNVSCKIPEGCIYGMVGSNGAGKSTALRTLCGVYKAEQGEVLFDERPVFDNTEVKKDLVFISDDLYFINAASPKRMAKLYKRIYPDFDYERFWELLDYFKLDKNKSIGTFSKGMKRQTAMVLALSCKPKYLFLDETFDGLDPVARKKKKSLIYNDVAERNMTTVVTSHSLRELEDLCDSLLLLHKGKVVLESDIGDLKQDNYKVQVAFDYDYDKSLFDELEIFDFEKKGSVSNFIVSAKEQDVKKILNSKKPVLLDILPLSLEEVFTIKMRELGYDFDECLEVKEDEK